MRRRRQREAGRRCCSRPFGSLALEENSRLKGGREKPSPHLHKRPSSKRKSVCLPLTAPFYFVESEVCLCLCWLRTGKKKQLKGRKGAFSRGYWYTQGWRTHGTPDLYAVTPAEMWFLPLWRCSTRSTSERRSYSVTTEVKALRMRQRPVAIVQLAAKKNKKNESAIYRLSNSLWRNATKGGDVEETFAWQERASSSKLCARKRLLGCEWPFLRHYRTNDSDKRQ